ncbi:MAG: hypothetical protein KAS66_15740 [Candidatus Omnitrophica bacterium]|nr:hypothetical protein [Candidatus Omnitrophota bacterium]
MNILEILGIVNACSIVILVIITGVYAFYTRKILKEQIDTNRKYETKYKLENVYSPLVQLISRYHGILSKEGLSESLYKKSFSEFRNQYSGIEAKYIHVFILDEKLRWFKIDITEMYKTLNSSEARMHDFKLTQFKRDKLSNSLKNFHSHLIDEIFSFIQEMEGNNSLKDSVYDNE